MTTTDRHLYRVQAPFSLGPDSLVLADNTLWSHAASMGTRTKGGQFTIGPDEVRNAVQVFTAGYPQKIPVDYNHGATDDDPEIRKLRAQGLVPKAGDVQELRAVVSAADFTGDLKAAAEKLTAQAGRPLDDARNFGLWIRWKPTSRALAAIKAGEYTELSITFDEDLPHNADAHGQGFGLWAVALLNTPFLDDMLPVAASRDTDPSPGDRRSASLERPMTVNTKLLSLVAAVRGKPVSTDDEAITELTALQTEITELRTGGEFRAIVSAEFAGEKDPAKLVAAVRELRLQVKTATDAAAAQRKVAIKTSVDATIKTYEPALTSVPLREMLSRNLTKELEDGVELETTETLKTLKSLDPSGMFAQHSAADIGGAGVGDDVKIDARANELLDKDPQLKALAQRNWSEAYKQATQRASRELRSAATAAATA